MWNASLDNPVLSVLSRYNASVYMSESREPPWIEQQRSTKAAVAGKMCIMFMSERPSVYQSIYSGNIQQLVYQFAC